MPAVTGLPGARSTVHVVLGDALRWARLEDCLDFHDPTERPPASDRSAPTAPERQSAPQPQVDGDAVRDFLAHLAVHRHVSASTQNEAGCAILFLCREVLGLEAERLSDVKARRRGSHLPVVLSVPEVAALLGALEGTPWLMAALIYGGGLESRSAARSVSKTSTSTRA